MQKEAIIWYMTATGWLVDSKAENQKQQSNKQHPVLVVRYEDLVQDTQHELKRILEFVEVPYSSKQLQEVVRSGYSDYRRHHEAELEFEHYTMKQKKRVNQMVSSLLKLLKKNGYDSMDVTDYVAAIVQ